MRACVCVGVGVGVTVLVLVCRPLNDEQPCKLPEQAGPENGFKLLISAVNDEDNNGNFRLKMAAPVPAHVCGCVYVCVCLCVIVCVILKNNHNNDRHCYENSNAAKGNYNNAYTKVICKSLGGCLSYSHHCLLPLSNQIVEECVCVCARVGARVRDPDTSTYATHYA